jgi:hypothetical protein
MSDKRRDMPEKEIESLLERLPRPSPSAALWERVSAHAGGTDGETRHRRRRRRWLGWGVALAAACCLIVALYPRGPQEPTAHQVARSAVQGRVEPATRTGTATLPRDEVPVGSGERTASQEQEPPARIPAEVETAAADWAVTAEPPAVTASEGGLPLAEVAEPTAMEPDSADVQVSEPAEEQLEQTSGYFAVVSLPDGRRSVLRQSTAATDLVGGMTVRLEYRTIPAENEEPGIGG